MNNELIAIFTEKGLTLDTGATANKQFYINDRLLSDFAEDPYKALLYFGFEEKSLHMSQSVMFLHGVAVFFVEKLSKNPDLEITRSAAPLTADEAASLLQKTPYTIGAEFLDYQWLVKLWGGLTRAVESELAAFDGAAATYLL